MAAFPAQKEVAEDREEVQKAEGVVTNGAMGSAVQDRFFLDVAIGGAVDEAADTGAEEEGKDTDINLDCDREVHIS